MQHCNIVEAATFFSVTLEQPLAANNANNAKWLWSALPGCFHSGNSGRKKELTITLTSDSYGAGLEL